MILNSENQFLVFLRMASNWNLDRFQLGVTFRISIKYKDGKKNGLYDEIRTKIWKICNS